MREIVVKAPAKLNLALDIVGVNEDHYHKMKMIMQTIDLFDVITIQLTDDEIQLSCNRPEVPCNQHNIAYRCAQALMEYVGILTYGFKIDIQKQIPIQAGMAGGSADGAAVLVGLNELYQLGLSVQQLCAIGAKVGADIPFCIIGGTAKVEGIGEVIIPIDPMPDCIFAIAKPKTGISTQKAFMDFDLAQIPPRLDLEQMITAIKQQDIYQMSNHMYNALEQVCTVRDIQIIRNKMLSFGAKNAMMTGSGSAVFGVFTNAARAYECEQKLKSKYSETFLCKPIPYGCRVVKTE